MELQPALLDLGLAPQSEARRPAKRALRVRDVSVWAGKQVRWIAARSQASLSSDLFIYEQAAKLVEEVGELHGQLLGRSRLQRSDKHELYDTAGLAAELADVAICVAIVSEVLDIDLASALEAKMQIVDERVAKAPLAAQMSA